MYPDTLLFIDGRWVRSSAGTTLPVLNPATGAVIGQVEKAGYPDLDNALAAAERGFAVWKRMTARERAAILHAAADNVLERVEDIATVLSLEQGKPLADARSEVRGAVDVINWFGEEAVRVYGRMSRRVANMCTKWL